MKVSNRSEIDAFDSKLLPTPFWAAISLIYNSTLIQLNPKIMKTLVKFSTIAIVLLCAIHISCNKEENPVNDPSSSLQLKNGEVFTVAPSGNYEDDSYNIQTALNNAKAAGQGSTVQLTAGTFYLKYNIEIDGFDGYVKGAGKQVTIVTTHDKIDCSLPSYLDCIALMTFRHGYVRMSDLTFSITDPEPSINTYDDSWWQGALPMLISVTGDQSISNDQNGSSFINNVEFIGGAGNLFGFNVGGFLWIGSETLEFVTGGNQKITKCLFQNAVNSVSNYLDNNSTWLVGGNAADGNTFKDSNWPLTIGEFCNSTAEISFNKFENFHWGAIFLSQGQFSDPANLSLSTYLVQHNDIENRIEIEGWADGISLIDNTNFLGGGKTINAVVKSNQIFNQGTEYFGGIYGFAANDIIVKNNKVWGDCVAGIYAGINGDETTNWFMQGNNVQNAEALAAPVWLGEGTSYYTVIGGSNKTKVWDEGTNNTLTGVTEIQGYELGQQAQEAHALMHEIMQNFKNH
jgi:hypothetical protein